jgi:hypothetical protein
MPDWESLLANPAPQQPTVVVAQTFENRFHTASQPVLLACDDGNEYVVKSPHAGRMIVTDQIVGRIGSAAGAPVGKPAIVDVPAALIAAEPQMAHMTAGLAHGSQWIPSCTQGGVDHCATNRGRFAQLALLYGWALGGDHQFIYENAEPRNVWSVDHGHFFAGSQSWTVATLQAAPPAIPDNVIVAGCSLTDDELDAARGEMTVPTDEQLAAAVAAPLDAWGITVNERVALAEYLAIRRDAIFAPPNEEAE